MMVYHTVIEGDVQLTIEIEGGWFAISISFVCYTITPWQNCMDTLYHHYIPLTPNHHYANRNYMMDKTPSIAAV